MKTLLISLAASTLCLSGNLLAQDARPPSQSIEVRPHIYLTAADMVKLSVHGASFQQGASPAVGHPDADPIDVNNCLISNASKAF